MINSYYNQINKSVAISGYSDNNLNLDQRLLKAYEDKSYVEAAELIRQGANCEQLVKIDRPRIIEAFMKLFSFQVFGGEEDKYDLLDLCIGEDLSLDFSRMPNQYNFYQIAGGEEGLEKTKFLLKFLGNLPLPFLAILEEQEEVVDAILERGINFNTMNLKYELTGTDASFKFDNVKLDVNSFTVAFDEVKNGLAFALGTKSLKAVELFLRFGADPKQVYNEMPQLFEFALKAGHYEIAKACLDQKKINDSMPNSYHFYPLSQADVSMNRAAEGGNLQIVQMLIDEGISVNKPTGLFFDESTPFKAAMNYGHLEVAELLLENGAEFDFTLQDDKSQEIFEWAAKHGKPEFVKFLVDHGCATSYTYTWDDGDTSECNLLDCAMEAGNEGNIRLAVELGFDINTALGNLFSLRFEILPFGMPPVKHIEPLTHLQLIDLAVELGVDVKKWQFEEGGNLLYAAAEYGLVEEFNKLLDLGVDPKATGRREGHQYIYDLSEDSDTCNLTFAAATGGSVEILQKLINLGVDCHYISESRQNALFEACGAEIVDFLVKQSLDLNQADVDGFTPLFYCAWDEETAEALIKNGADVNHVNKLGETALFYAEYEDGIRVLLKYGADIHHTDSEGESPLFQYLDEERIDCFVQNGMDINHKNHNGDTALIAHASKDNYYVMKSLLNAGADPSHKNNDGKTAFDVLFQLHKEPIEQGDCEYGVEQVLAMLDPARAKELFKEDEDFLS